MANDPYWNNTVLLLHGDTAGDPNFSSMVMGGSGAKASIESGTPLIGGSASIVTVGGRQCFDLSNAADSTRFAGGYGAQTAVFDGDFTLEWWFYQTADVAYNSYGGSVVGATVTYSACSLYFTSAGLHTISIRNSGLPSFTFSPPKNQWNHHALVVSGGVGSYYVNGVRKTSGSVGATAYPTVNGFRFGYVPSMSDSGIPGYLSGMRLYKGIAKYSGASFTVPGWPDLPFSAIIDSSPAGRGVSASGSAVAPYVADSKFGGGCMRFDGASGALMPTQVAFGLADFTIEMWIKPLSLSGYQCVIVMSAGSAPYVYMGINTGTDGTPLMWNDATAIASQTKFVTTRFQHWVLQRKAGVAEMYLDGALVGTYAFAGSLAAAGAAIGYSGVNQWFTGYLDDLRITTGVARYASGFTPAVNALSATDPNWGSTVLAMSFNTDFTDSKGHAITSYGGCAIDTTTKKFGTGSVYFDGVDDYLSAADSSEWDFGVGDFTVEVWVRLASTPTGISMFVDHAFGGIALYTRADSKVAIGQDNVLEKLVGNTVLAINTWYHVAACRLGGVLMLFINGVMDATPVVDNAVYTSTNRLCIGTGNEGTQYRLNGYLDDLRVTKGYSRYGRFTPPTQALPEGLTTVSGTVTDATGALCARTVNVHSRATGRLLGTAVSDPVTGVYSIGAAEPCYVVVLDSTGDYDALILDRIDPVT